MNRKAALVVILLILFGSTFPVEGKEKGSWKDLYLKTGDIKIHYIEAGTGDRILIFIPGWTMNAEVWKEQIPYFAARGFRVIALDPRSQGLTTKTESGNTYRQQAADFHAFLKQLKLEHSYMVGWSSGAVMLMEYLSSSILLKPEKVVFVDGAPAALKTEDYPGVITVEKARKLMLGIADDRKKTIEQYVRGLFKERPAEWLIKDMIKTSLDTPRSASLSLYFDQFTGDWRQALSQVPVPSLIITTSENKAIGEYMKTKIPRATLEVIDGVGSAMFLEKPQAFNQALEDFLGEH
jgi:non-heme chloroperoxidase